MILYMAVTLQEIAVKHEIRSIPAVMLLSNNTCISFTDGVEIDSIKSKLDELLNSEN